MTTDADEELRTCPRCGKPEPVSVDVLAYALEQGWADEWLCWECWAEMEIER